MFEIQNIPSSNPAPTHPSVYLHWLTSSLQKQWDPKDQCYLCPHFLWLINPFQEIRQMEEHSRDGEFYVWTWLGHRMPRPLIRHYSGLSVRLFLDEINVRILRLGEANSSMWVGLTQSGEDLKRIERLSKRKLLLLWLLELGEQYFLAF